MYVNEYFVEINFPFNLSWLNSIREEEVIEEKCTEREIEMQR